MKRRRKVKVCNIKRSQTKLKMIIQCEKFDFFLINNNNKRKTNKKEAGVCVCVYKYLKSGFDPFDLTLDNDLVSVSDLLSGS